MLQIIDQRWQDHLVGHGLPERGHQPPGHGQPGPAGGLAARGLRHVRQADGRINDDYLRYVFHVQVLAEPAEEPDCPGRVLAADDPAAGSASSPRSRPTSSPSPRPRSPSPPADRHRRPGPTATPPRRRRRGPSGPAALGTPPGWQRRRLAGQGGRFGPSSPTVTDRRRTASQDRAQRPVLVRERQEVQALPRRD